MANTTKEKTNDATMTNNVLFWSSAHVGQVERLANSS